MLDQNTDRMWYVIGAVLIGAAIIFGMNTFMPSAFASVGNMFEGTADNATIIIQSSIYTGNMEDYKPKSVPLSEYVIASDDDFKLMETIDGDKVGLEHFRYVGSDDYVIIPDVIHDVPVTEYSFMFDEKASPVKGVASNNTNVESMWNMFSRSKSRTVDLSHLSTSNVKNMNNMFAYSNISHVNLDGFDTSNVENFNGMFMSAPFMALDLSHFDTSKANRLNGVFSHSNLYDLNIVGWVTPKVSVTSGLFEGTNLKSIDLSTMDFTQMDVYPTLFDNMSNLDIGYARTQADADILNEIVAKDIFVVK